MSAVLVVTEADITVKPNGIGGYELTYYGNKKWWSWTLKGVNPTSFATAKTDFVSFLNSIPIVQPEKYPARNHGCSLVD